MMTLGMMQRQKSSQRGIKALLVNSSPNNPTYILAIVLEDFTSQGFTELTVKKGDEIYVMYEIDDWAYVACLTETSVRGYIPLDYCLPVQDFFYDNPALNKQLQQNGGTSKTSNSKVRLHQPPITSRQQSRKTLEPIEGSEMPSAVEHQIYHSTGMLTSTLPQRKSNGDTRRTQHSRTVRRSNTIASTSKPTVTFHSNVQNDRRKFRPTVPKKPIVSSTLSTPMNGRITSAAAIILPNTVVAKPLNLQQPTASPTTSRQQNSNAHTAMKAKKSWGHHREKHSMEDHRRSLSLETVDETSEFEESLTSGNGGPGGIQRLIAKFQSRIKEEHQDLTGACPRLNSIDSIVSSLSEDNDSVFTDSEEAMPRLVSPEELQGYSKVDCTSLENKLSALQPLGQSTPNNLDVSGNHTDENASCEDNLEVNKSSTPELEERVDNSAMTIVLDLSTIESITSSSLVDDNAADDINFLEDSLLEPPISFSSPSLSESAVDVTTSIEASSQHSHCCCCKNYKHSTMTSAESQLNISAADSVSEQNLDLVNSVERETGDAVESEANEKNKNLTQTTDTVSSNPGETTKTEKTNMCDESTQTAQDVTDKKQPNTSIKKSNSAFSRNSKYRQSSLCTGNTESHYLLQPISPANITADKVAVYDTELSERTRQQCSVML